MRGVGARRGWSEEEQWGVIFAFQHLNPGNQSQAGVATHSNILSSLICFIKHQPRTIDARKLQVRFLENATKLDMIFKNPRSKLHIDCNTGALQSKPSKIVNGFLQTTPLLLHCIGLVKERWGVTTSVSVIELRIHTPAHSSVWLCYR